MKSLYLALACTFLLSACAQTPSDQRAESAALVEDALTDMELERSGPIERIPNFQIDSWKYVDHYHIVIETHREQYLIALQNYCSGINGAIEIGYTSRTGALTRFEKILVHQGFGRPEECYIEDIVKLNAVSPE